VDRTEIRPAIVAGAHYLAFHVKVAGEKEELLDNGVVVAWNVSASIHADERSIALAGLIPSSQPRDQFSKCGVGAPLL
jgi:hypothetical protein